MKKYLSMAVLCMSLLTACGNNDKNEEVNSTKIVKNNQQEVSLDLVLPISFKTVKKRSKSFDQLHFYFSKETYFKFKN